MNTHIAFLSVAGMGLTLAAGHEVRASTGKYPYVDTALMLAVYIFMLWFAIGCVA